MILEFITKIDQNGNHKYLWFDTTARQYSTLSTKMIDDGILVRTKDIKYIQQQLIAHGYKFKWTE